MNGVEDILREYDYVNFESQGEGWSTYHLTGSDTIAKLKPVLMKVLKRPDGSYDGISAVVMTVLCDKEDRRSPSTIPLPNNPQDLEEQLTQIDLDFKIMEEPWNKYTLADGATLSLRTTAIQFNSTKFYDAMGDPVFNIIHHTLVKTTPPL